MSLDLVKEIFSTLPDCKEWHAHLLSFTHSKCNGTTYNCRRIELEPSERLSILIQDISSKYTDEGKNKLDNYVDVTFVAYLSLNPARRYYVTIHGKMID